METRVVEEDKERDSPISPDVEYFRADKQQHVVDCDRQENLISSSIFWLIVISVDLMLGH